MARQVKVGLVGTSWWADMMFLPILSKYERVSLTAICGRNRERADEMAAKYSIPQVYTDYRQMIEQAGLEAIIVAASDDVHHPIVMAALDAGLHVLCDKPVALNAAHAKEMSDAAQEKGVKHLVLFTWSWLPAVQKAKQLIDDGYFGTLYHGTLRALTGYGRDPGYSWRFDVDRANGIAGDWGAHAFFMARLLLGDVVAVTARLGFHVKHTHPDGSPVRQANDSAWITLEHVNGAITQIQLSAVAHPGSTEHTDIILSGERGSAEVGWAWGENGLLNHVHAGQQEGEPLNDDYVTDFFDLFQTQSIGVRQFIDSIVDDKPSFPGLFEGYQTQRIIDAALQSHETGCRVVISP